MKINISPRLGNLLITIFVFGIITVSMVVIMPRLDNYFYRHSSKYIEDQATMHYRESLPQVGDAYEIIRTKDSAQQGNTGAATDSTRALT